MAIFDTASGLTVYAEVETLEYFEELDIILVSMFGDENLAVKERAV